MSAPHATATTITASAAALLLALLSGCAANNMPELKTVDYVDLDRFMGDWYVIANIPTFLDKNAHNAIERYEMADDGRILTTFSFHKNSYEGAKKVYRPEAFIRNRKTNAEWGMQFVWPFKADYRVIYLNNTYTITVVGRNKRDFLWIMARTPSIPSDELESLLKLASERGYDRADIVSVPQRW